MRRVIMSRRFRIRVYGKQRNNIDPALLAHIVILFGRHLHHQQQEQQRQGQAGVSKQDARSSRHREKSAQVELSDSGEAAGGGSS